MTAITMETEIRLVLILGAEQFPLLVFLFDCR